ncbi:hypothetical protein Rsub_07059 [Raphidocelis subcapitata]|uniref:Uncharacterized protein n=1 Tax=Raphidocelis subcapitata TaxID=307507 RepID=A0A2V0PBQ5_9CHLO|nr:hypothetical protein Rsub_07059 [Raphidocelis subcapitata]|eukprot:GBF94525.1 hypothetical protein Rsub_07059 [Raphidocelis subcapitata]
MGPARPSAPAAPRAPRHSARLPTPKGCGRPPRLSALPEGASSSSSSSGGGSGSSSSGGGSSGGAGGSTNRRRAAALLAAAVAAPWLLPPLHHAAHAAPRGGADPALIKAFTDAMAAQGNPEAMERAWSRAIELAPDNAAAWSNRGTARLQAGRWADAYSDLSKSLELEAARCGGARMADGASALVLNQLGNAEGALGRWGDAMAHFREAAEDPELESIAGANYALAAFETGQQELAVKEARLLLRRDPSFLDMRAALAAFLWADGAPAAAEGEWEALQSAGGGLGAALYGRDKAVARVRGRWPPRATAALAAFLAVSERGGAEGYDGRVREYVFDRAAASK